MFWVNPVLSPGSEMPAKFLWCQSTQSSTGHSPRIPALVSVFVGGWSHLLVFGSAQALRRLKLALPHAKPAQHTELFLSPGGPRFTQIFPTRTPNWAKPGLSGFVLCLVQGKKFKRCRTPSSIACEYWRLMEWLKPVSIIQQHRPSFLVSDTQFIKIWH